MLCHERLGFLFFLSISGGQRRVTAKSFRIFTEIWWRGSFPYGAAPFPRLPRNRRRGFKSRGLARGARLSGGPVSRAAAALLLPGASTCPWPGPTRTPRAQAARPAARTPCQSPASPQREPERGPISAGCDAEVGPPRTKAPLCSPGRGHGKGQQPSITPAWCRPPPPRPRGWPSVRPAVAIAHAGSHRPRAPQPVDPFLCVEPAGCGHMCLSSSQAGLRK